MGAVGTQQFGRREARRQSRRDAIVAVAARYFLDQGYAGTTMSGIAASLGGSKGTLWNYFPSKEELFAAVLDRLTEDFQAQVLLILNPEHDVHEALRGFCREFLARANAPDGIALYRLIVAESARFPELGRIFDERGPRITYLQLTKFLRAAIAKGQLRPGDPAVAARQLIGLCLSGSRQRLLIGLAERLSPEEQAEDVDVAMDMFLRAYAV